MNRRTTAAIAGSVVVVAAAAAIWTVAATKDDSYPLPKPTPGTAMSYRLAIPSSSAGSGGQFPLDGATAALTSDGGAVLAVGAPVHGLRLSPSGNLSQIAATNLSTFHPVATPAGPVLVSITGSGIAAYDPKTGSLTTIPNASNLAAASASPIGELADGTILAADSPQETIWSLKGGKAEPLVKFPTAGLNQHCSDVANGQECTDYLLTDTVVDAHGAIYTLESYTGSDRNELAADHYAPLNTLLTVPAAGGMPTHVALPASIPGVPGDPGALRTLAVTAAADGVYALVETPHGDFTSARYVLHLHSRGADVVATQAALPAGGSAAQCAFKGSVSPTALPCLPDQDASLAYGDGRLLIAGWLDAPNNSPASQTANVVIGVGD